VFENQEHLGKQPELNVTGLELNIDTSSVDNEKAMSTVVN
jgi:hypothetical protein